MLHAPDFLGLPDGMALAKIHPERVKAALQMKKTGNSIVACLGGREVHPINVRLGGFYRAPTASELQALAPELRTALGHAEELLEWLGTFDYPEFARDYELVSLCHPHEYPMNERRLVDIGEADDEPAERLAVCILPSCPGATQRGTGHLFDSTHVADAEEQLLAAEHALTLQEMLPESNLGTDGWKGDEHDRPMLRRQDDLHKACCDYATTGAAAVSSRLESLGGEFSVRYAQQQTPIGMFCDLSHSLIITVRRRAVRNLPARIVKWFVLACVIAGCSWRVNVAAQGPAAAGSIVVELFSRDGCSRCRAAEAYLLELQRGRRGLQIAQHDVVHDAAALARLKELTQQAGFQQVAVPSLYVRGRLFIGFDSAETTGAAIERWLDGDGSAVASTEVPAAACEAETAGPCPEPPPKPLTRVRLPWLGDLDVRTLGLPLFTFLVGLIDGFNPCAMWVLMFLLSMLVHLKNRARMALVGGTFVVVSGLVYFAFMAAWLNVFLLIGLSRAIQLVLGVLAIAIGSVHIKDFFAFQKGFSLSIPKTAKPGIYRRIRDVLHAENLRGALTGVVILAVLVNMIELLCTAGLPAIYTQVLVGQGVTTAAHYAYLALYNVAYMLDDTIMLTLAIVTLSQRKLQEGGGRLLKLASGSVIVVLGLLLVFKPEWLTW